MKYTRIFISHDSGDIKKAEELKEYIEEQEYLSSILIVRDKQPNVLIEKQVEKGVKCSNYFIPILTCNSLNSIWVNQEIGFAKGTGRQIYALIQNNVLEDLKGFIHKHREHFIFDKISYKSKYIELIDYIKENEGLGEPNFNKKRLESDGDKSELILFKQKITDNSFLHIKVNLFDDLQEFVIYFQVGNDSSDEKFKYIGFSNSNKVNNSADHVRGFENIYQIDIPGKTKYKKTININNAIKQSGLFFKSFPNIINKVKIRNINGEIGKSNTFYYAVTDKD